MVKWYMITKICITCKTDKPLREFRSSSKHSAVASQGTAGKCLECWNDPIALELKRVAARTYMLKTQYNITPEQYNDLLIKQDFRCAGCAKHISEFVKSLSIDHDHLCCSGKGSCGKCIRGLLCSGCNTALGFVSDNIDTLKRLTIYLEKAHDPQGVDGP